LGCKDIAKSEKCKGKINHAIVQSCYRAIV
jgi:hypothetical protein